MQSIALIETITIIIIVLLWGVNPRNKYARRVIKMAFILVCILGAFIHYTYLLTLPTQKVIYPFFLVERKTYSVVYPDIGQFLIILLLTDYILSKRARKDFQDELTKEYNVYTNNHEQEAFIPSK